MADKPDLETAYDLKSPEDSVRLYRDWANTYDSGFAAENDYLLPFHVAEAFASAGGHGPVLDVGAGTGLVGEHLARLNRGPIHATDISPDMLDRAREKGVYDTLFVGDVTGQLGVADGTYTGIVSAGTFTLGHVGPEALDELMRIAQPNALFVLSINAKHFSDAGFEAKLTSFGTRIKGLTLPKVRIYGEDADPAHRLDEAVLAMFLKA